MKKHSNAPQGLHVRNGGRTVDTDLEQPAEHRFQESESGSGLVMALSFFVAVTVTAFLVGFFTR